MIIKILVKILGGPWKLREKCNQATGKFFKKCLIKIYRAHQAQQGASIAWNAEIDGIPCLPHGFHGIFIAATSKIGKNCIIFHHVTIGANTLTDSKSVGAPTIGDNCYIGSGAKIVGNVTLGNNVRVGANCVVYEDVPDNAVVVSGAQKVITKDKPLTNRFHIYDGKWSYYDDGKWIAESDKEVIKALEFCEKAFKI